jgi:hypothetical protein
MSSDSPARKKKKCMPQPYPYMPLTTNTFKVTELEKYPHSKTLMVLAYGSENAPMIPENLIHEDCEIRVYALKFSGGTHFFSACNATTGEQLTHTIKIDIIKTRVSKSLFFYCLILYYVLIYYRLQK